MRNRKRFIKFIWMMSRLVIALTGFFVLLCVDGLSWLELPGEIAQMVNASPDASLEKQDTADLNTEVQSDKPELKLQESYTVKINELTFSLGTLEDVRQVLTAAKDVWDVDNEYQVQFIVNGDTHFDIIEAQIVKRVEDSSEMSLSHLASGAGAFLTDDAGGEVVKDVGLGIRNLYFGDKVIVARALHDSAELMDVEEATRLVLQLKQMEERYEVQPGDTLSEIAIEHDISMQELADINESIEDENSVIRVGDELIITVAQPELAIVRTERQYYEENYEAEVEYVDNDSWYTTDKVTLQDPISGYHKVVADITYRNDREEGREIKQEEVVVAAVPKIVERGTKVPPTFLKPISGGRLSSPFGKRTAPKKGASTYHKGIDWATPIGTAVAASSSGTVIRAGWGSGYGNVVYISHPDGRETRYGHLSKVLVRVGQHVNQGEKIALTGNTGRSTGPHIHFEILVNGVAVDPFKYMN